MAHSPLSDDAPATMLFPQFESALYNMITTEIAGLTEVQLDFESDRWKWSEWSIRRNVSHVASGNFRWFWRLWGQQLFPEGLPNAQELDQLVTSPYERRLYEDLYLELDVILDKLHQGLVLAQFILSQETVGSLRAKEVVYNHDIERWPWFLAAHPTGLRREIEEASGESTTTRPTVYMSLEATFRHRYFEHITHLYNIQRLKRAQGLTTSIDIPFEGYWALPSWDRSEP